MTALVIVARLIGVAFVSWAVAAATILTFFPCFIFLYGVIILVNVQQVVGLLINEAYK